LATGDSQQDLEGHLEPRVAAVTAQVLNAWIRAVEVERRIRELDEIDEKVAALEELVEANNIPQSKRFTGWAT
jgi:hypothetical protein